MRSRRSRWLRPALLSGLLGLSSCAFANPANRPVWNVFEENVVPESDGAFWATLPLTVPLGVLAILVDTFVAHPLQVVDDAWDDTVGIWRNPQFEKEYYTTSASLPFRALATPVVFVGSFLGRSAFDIPDPDEAQERYERLQDERRQAMLDWLEHIATGAVPSAHRRFSTELDEETVMAVRRALEGGGPQGRIRVYRAVARSTDPNVVDWLAALRDPSAVVRFSVLEILPRTVEIPQTVIDELLADPDEAVRERANARWDS